jgi:hypothetical protein
MTLPLLLILASFDLPKAMRRQIATKLEKSGVAPQKTGKLKEFMPVGRSERISLHDESLSYDGNWVMAK